MTRYSLQVPGVRTAALHALAGCIMALPVAAQSLGDERPYCASRPGLGTTPCTIAPKRVAVELALADWERDAGEATRSDTMLVGEIAGRFGIGPNTEVSVDWTPFGETWVAGGGLPTRRGLGTGDLTVATKINLKNPDGNGVSIAVAPYLGLPVGGTAIGSGQWASGVILPVSYALGGPFSLQATPQFTLETAGRGGGHHASGRIVGGLGIAVSDRVALTEELSVGRQHDGAATVTQGFAATSIAYTTANRFQLDAGAVFGLNDHSPDARFYLGVSHQF
ncbi:hypothetical protein GCM10011380_17470 [Sphingomonas metalli]|uniref:Transporter n=1 Tax=Sphingomonas metalli TaxID=1779358 RepID=A0A916T1P2_9SPHN|nr:transporter [Sphingomonas metalli]GGB28378.1 hypothetical protein GCM10011380_17470 [Sphingomonas metalli]